MSGFTTSVVGIFRWSLYVARFGFLSLALVHI